jgi:hypothetical protein
MAHAKPQSRFDGDIAINTLKKAIMGRQVISRRDK